MSTGTTTLTELEAINTMLSAVWEAPVNSLDVAGIEDVAIAQRTLANEVRFRLARGSANNIERCVTLSRDANTGKIPVPANALRVDVERSEGVDAVQRGPYLYDRTNHTFIFDRDLKCEVFYHLEWDDLPEHIKNAVMVLASRKFQAEVLGSADKGKYTSADELEARALFNDADTDLEDSNMSTDSWSVASILCR